MGTQTSNEDNEMPQGNHPKKELTQQDLQDVNVLNTSNEIKKILELESKFPLHDAIYMQNFTLVEELLETKHDPNVPDIIGCTPLVIALYTPCGNDPTEVVKLLLKYGADPNQSSATPIEHFYRCPTNF
jgi:ankyrin repeat protein